MNASDGSAFEFFAEDRGAEVDRNVRGIEDIAGWAEG